MSRRKVTAVAIFLTLGFVALSACHKKPTKKCYPCTGPSGEPAICWVYQWNFDTPMANELEPLSAEMDLAYPPEKQPVTTTGSNAIASWDYDETSIHVGALFNMDPSASSALTVQQADGRNWMVLRPTISESQFFTWRDQIPSTVQSFDTTFMIVSRWAPVQVDASAFDPFVVTIYGKAAQGGARYELEQIPTSWAETLGAQISGRILALPDACFDSTARARKDAFTQALADARSAAEARDFATAKSILLNSVRPHTDSSVGGDPQDDWVVDTTRQSQILLAINTYVTALDTAAASQ